MQANDTDTWKAMSVRVRPEIWAKVRIAAVARGLSLTQYLDKALIVAVGEDAGLIEDIQQAPIAPTPLHRRQRVSHDPLALDEAPDPMTPQQAALVLRVSQKRIYQLIDEGKLTATRQNGLYSIGKRAVVARIFQRQKQEGLA